MNIIVFIVSNHFTYSNTVLTTVLVLLIFIMLMLLLPTCVLRSLVLLLVMLMFTQFSNALFYCATGAASASASNIDSFSSFSENKSDYGL
jgi:hypothetical protein